MKAQTIKTAVESATLLLRIDDIVSGMSKKDKTAPGQARPPGPQTEDADNVRPITCTCSCAVCLAEEACWQLEVWLENTQKSSGALILWRHENTDASVVDCGIFDRTLLILTCSVLCNCSLCDSRLLPKVCVVLALACCSLLIWTWSRQLLTACNVYFAYIRSTGD